MFTQIRKSIHYILFAALFLLLNNQILHAGTTGKIAGRVIDAETGESVIGANIILMDQTLGGAADIDGNYFIINIPPGVYDIRASSIGYQSVTLQGVRVSVDQTTKLDFELNTESVEIGDVVVTAVKPIVRKDLTSTESKVSGDDIALLPLEDVSSVVNLQAGVVNGHFRGGRSNEVKYLVDGVAVNDAYSGESALSAEVNSLEEVQVLIGTFNAEYGEALSGIVNQITKVAKNEIEGDISFYGGDYISSRDDIFENINDVSPVAISNIQGSISGPIPGLGNAVKFFLSGRYYNDDGYIYGRRQFNPSDSSDFSANNPDDWYVGATGDNEYVPMRNNRRYTLQGKLAFDVGDGKGIVVNTLFQDQKYREYDHQYKLNPDGDYERFNQSLLTSLSYTHVLSNSAFIDFLASGFQTKYNQYVFENPLDPGYVDPARKRDVSGNAFLTGGTENWHFEHTSTTYTGKIDMTWQINHIHQLKTGLDYQYHDIDYQDFQIVIDASNNYQPSIPASGNFNNNTYKANPTQFAVYAQDKIELDYLIVNLGLRFDYFDPDGRYLIDPNRINELDAMQPPYPDSLMADAQTKYQVSPRLGISYPITDRGAIHISYGHFFQVPPFANLYMNPNFRIPLTGDFPSTIGKSIGNTDLEPQQTIMYEIGLQQQLTDDIGITLTGYYKDIRNLLGTEIHIKNEFKKFSKLINIDYGSVKGITFSFEKRFSGGIGTTIDYTFQVAQGNASDPNAEYEKAQASPPIEANKQLVPLNWDQTHSLNFTITGGIPGDYIASCIGRLGSGLPYTPAIQNQRTGLENSDRRPTKFNVDLFLTKYFALFGIQSSVFLKVYNLFDTANEIDVYSDTGRSGYSLEVTRNQEAPRGVNTIEEYYTRPDFYSAPRQIILGASFAF